MSDRPHPSPDHDPGAGDTFDGRMRSRYRQATTHLSARTQAQLQQRFRAASSTPTASAAATTHGSRRLAWSLAVAGSLAVAVGLSLRGTAPDASDPRSLITSNASSSSDQLVATLDETPDLYLWVASSDATTMTPETR